MRVGFRSEGIIHDVTYLARYLIHIQDRVK